MKTSKLNKQILYNVAYDYDFVDAANWIDNNSDILFKSELSTMTYQFDSICGDYRVLARAYRHREWVILFLSKNARSVLQSLYDFIYS